MATDFPEARAIMLEAILPNGVDVWVALFDGSPIAGGTELALTGYTRVAWQTWVTVDLTGASERRNNADIVWPIITQAGEADHWAIYDSAVGGVLLRAGLTTDGLGTVGKVTIGVGDEPRILSGKLRVGLTEQAFDEAV